MTNPANKITDDLDNLLEVLPESITSALRGVGRFDELIEIVMDLGRAPESRYASVADPSQAELILRQEEVSLEDLAYVVGRIGNFDTDNRAGITRTLHRISGIKNRRGAVVGLTCRVGRAVYGTLGIIEDFIASGKSILLLGRPGIGKTTMLREAARVLADAKRVVIVDTSNEIGGDGDIPHPAVGRARRMQVAKPSLQHEVMIEAVENHNPQVIVIDEIGRALEAEAARTIAERGVQLIGTAHGQTLENLMSNPTLSDLIGGIESVTLSDEEARRRGTQKTVLERRAPPTFDVLIEIHARNRLIVHPSVADAVDAILRGRVPVTELRYVDAAGAVQIERTRPVATPVHEFGARQQGNDFGQRQRGGDYEQRPRAGDIDPRQRGPERVVPPPAWLAPVGQPADMRSGETRAIQQPRLASLINGDESDEPERQERADKRLQLFAFGIARNRLVQAVRQMGVPADVVDSIDDADVLITSKAYYRQRAKTVADAESRNVPIYVLRSNSQAQMDSCLVELFNVGSNGVFSSVDAAMTEAEEAIQRVLAGDRLVDLSPQNSYIRRKQHERIRSSNLISHSYGREPGRRVRVFRD